MRVPGELLYIHVVCANRVRDDRDRLQVALENEQGARVREAAALREEVERLQEKCVEAETLVF